MASRRLYRRNDAFGKSSWKPRCSYTPACVDAGSSGDGIVVGWCDVSGGFNVESFDLAHPQPTRKEAFHLSLNGRLSDTGDDTKWLAVGFLSRHGAKEVLMCQEGSREILQCALPSTEHPETASRVFLHDDLVLGFCKNVSGSLMVSISRDGGVRLWDLYSGTLIDSTLFEYLSSGLYTAAGGGLQVVVGLQTGEFCLWDVSRFRLELQSTVVVGEAAVSTLAARLVHRSDRIVGVIVVGLSGGNVSVIERPLRGVTAWKPAVELPGSQTALLLTISPCGAYLSIVWREKNGSHSLDVYSYETEKRLCHHLLASAPLIVEFFMSSDAESREKWQIVVVYESGLPQIVTFSVPSPISEAIEQKLDLSESVPRPAPSVKPQGRQPEEMRASPSPLREAPFQPSTADLCALYQASACSDEVTDGEDLEQDRIRGDLHTASHSQRDSFVRKATPAAVAQSPAVESTAQPSLSVVDPSESEETLSSASQDMQLSWVTQAGTSGCQSPPSEIPSTEGSLTEGTVERPVWKYTSKLTERRINQCVAAEPQPDRIESPTPSFPAPETQAATQSTTVKDQAPVYIDLPLASPSINPTKARALPMQVDSKWLKQKAATPRLEDYWKPKTQQAIHL